MSIQATLGNESLSGRAGRGRWDATDSVNARTDVNPGRSEVRWPEGTTSGENTNWPNEPNSIVLGIVL